MGKLTDVYSKGHDIRQRCNVDIALDSLDTEDRQLLQELIDDEDVTAYRIWQLAREAGIRLGRDAVISHRKGSCRCNG